MEKTVQGSVEGARSRRESPVSVPMPEGGVYLLESHHAASFHMPVGTWPFHKLCWISIGQGLLDVGGSSVPLSQNEFALIPANLAHKFIDNPAEPMTLVIACIANERVIGGGSLAQLYPRLSDAFVVGQPIRARSAFHLNCIRDSFQLMLREQARKALGWESMIYGKLVQLMVTLLRGAESGGVLEPSVEAALAGMLEYLETAFDKPVVLQSLAKQCGVSVRRFTELFKSRTGCTVVEYVNRKRIDYAKERLSETGHIAYACYESGFQDMAYFYRTFKKHAGLTPGAFRNARGNG